MARVHVSSVIGAPVGSVWELARRFDAVEDFLPFVESSPIIDGEGSTSVGAVRRVTQSDGGVFDEVLVAHSDAERSYAYTFVGSPIPVREHRTTLAFRPITDGNRTLGEWTSQFVGEPDQEAELVTLIEKNFLAGLRALDERLRDGLVSAQ
jgi:hypothetical protein